MAVRKVIRMGHPTLREVAPQVPVEFIGSDDFNRLIEDMEDTLHDYGGVGLAAPQIDVRMRIAVIEIPGGASRYGDLEPMPFSVFVNPHITVLDATTAGNWEGCLSVPGLRGWVDRPQHIQVDYLDAQAQPQREEITGFTATVFQHEFDHLDGRLYIDHITDTTKLVFEEELMRYGDV